jgi:hypothetical protein
MLMIISNRIGAARPGSSPNTSPTTLIALAGTTSEMRALTPNSTTPYSTICVAARLRDA